MALDKSYKLMYFSVMALVFVIYYFLTGSSDAVGDTLISVVLVGFSTILTWAIIREQRKRGKMQ